MAIAILGHIVKDGDDIAYCRWQTKAGLNADRAEKTLGGNISPRNIPTIRHLKKKLFTRIKRILLETMYRSASMSAQSVLKNEPSVTKPVGS
jgi:hypothetical protein